MILPVALLLAASLLHSADFSTYRGFKFGTTLPAAAKRAEVNVTDARVIHQRPALIQEFEWRPVSAYATSSVADPVRECRFRFYNGSLFQIITTYDQPKVEGMSDFDMIEAVSQTYGTATKPDIEIPFHSNYGEVAAVIARWETDDYSYNLVRTGDQTSYALIMGSKSMEALANTAILEALRLDTLEAPQRALALQKKQDAETRHSLTKARTANKPNFKP